MNKLFSEKFKLSSRAIILFFIFIFLFSFIFRNLLLNLSTNLIDGRDYSLMAWIMDQNATKILGLNFNNYFDANIYYPYKSTLLFSDLLLPQSIISIPFFLFTNNLILIFNSVFVATFILNYLSLYLFWNQIFKNNLIAFFGSIFFIFSPLFHLELSHFQMLTYWPFFLSLYFLMKYQRLSEDKPLESFSIQSAFSGTIFSNRFIPNLTTYLKSAKKFLFLSGLFLAVQFLASVYLSVFLMSVIVLYILINYLSPKSIKKCMVSMLIIFVTFLAVDGFFIINYFDVKQTYNINRELKEYVTYSAHLSDYLFTSSINSVIHRSFLVNKWNSFDKNFMGGHSSFPGFLIFLLAITSIFTISKNRDRFEIIISLNRQRRFFLSITIIGLIFSLGPRLNFNGNYAYIPLPYSLVLKTFPFAESIRAPSRWSFIFFLGITFFALSTINKFPDSKKKSYCFLIISTLFFLEYIPLNLQSEKITYINSQYTKLKQICSEHKKVLLEIPVTHLDVTPNVAVGLNYITKIQLASTYHNCYLINGYSGYDLPENFVLKDRLYQAIENNEINQFVNILKKKGVQILKINEKNLMEELKPKTNQLLQTLSENKKIKKIDNNIFTIQ